MAKQNNVFLYGFVENKPRIVLDRETKEPISAIGYIHVVRGVREAHDGKKYMKHDHPLIISLEPQVVKKMAEWKENDIVYVKGTIASKQMDKKSFCPNCTDPDGRTTENISKGLLVYVNPIFVKHIRDCPDKETALTDVIKCREISNQAIVLGILPKKPALFRAKHGLVIAQYQIATDRKFRIRTDDPEIRRDWPWVKSYGDQAIEDTTRLRPASMVIIDGCLQARNVRRKTKCKCCGQVYEWKDQTMEIVPYDTEYLKNYNTDQNLLDEFHADAETIRNMLFEKHLQTNVTDEEMRTDDIELDEDNPIQGEETKQAT